MSQEGCSPCQGSLSLRNSPNYSVSEEIAFLSSDTVLQTVPSTLFWQRAVSSCILRSTVGRVKKTGPKSNRQPAQPSGSPSRNADGAQVPIFSTAEDRSSSVMGSILRPPPRPRPALLLRYKCPSSKKNGNMGTCILCSEPSPAAQRALTTMTGAYAETTFPFRISAGAMAFISPLPTMDTTETEDPVAPLARWPAQPTCLATTPGDDATAPAPPAPPPSPAPSMRMRGPEGPRHFCSEEPGFGLPKAPERWMNSVMSD
ncbi:uncharacterized protein LOC115516552 [Lynx canadensis]|uniref:uncharacterized protein LOC115516552 n=1 Tax=Lynx canadensis TaxID=61383 RepID=UPI0011AFD686|nr:uncharacterized protein LOC115516552 [Lynx canadensis]XP_032449264.1 uncharacterized protein LOC115516552 [Lynx canadensis]XP_032449265.1 uncharacterized protein LOC115516552 [Lynx canadensis]